MWSPLVWFCIFFATPFLLPIILVGFLYFKSRVKYVVPKKCGDSVVLITGCDSGIGKASTEKLLKNGFHVIATIFTDKGQETLEAYAKSINALDRLTVTHVDITDEQSVNDLDKFVSEFLKKNSPKKLVSVVNNAGIALPSPLEVQPMAQFKKQINVNLIGHVHIAQVMIKYLRESKGRIVNIVSVAGRISGASSSAYSASKFGMEAVTNSLRLELQPWNISVSAIEPGFIRTPLVEGSVGNMAGVWDTLLPEAKTLYADALERSLKVADKVLGYALDPSHVAEKVYHAITAETPKTRYLVGYDAHIIAFCAIVLPDRLLDALLRATQ